MKFSDENDQFLGSLLPLHCQSYLKMQKWSKLRDINEYASLWGIQLEGSKFVEVILPMSQELKDYKRRMSELLTALEIAENRPVRNIVEDLLQANTDKFRIRLNKNSTKNLPLVKANSLLKRSLDVIVAAANSIVEARPYFQSRHPGKVEEFIDKLQMGHTEKGSFIITVHIPVPPRLGHDLEAKKLTADDEPFERLVPQRLSKLLALSNQIANIGDEEAFYQAVKDGMSANFCEAVADIVKLSDSDQADFSFSWAPSRPLVHQLVSKISLRQDTADVLKEAGRYLRVNVSEEVVEIIGYVVRLDKNHDAEYGEVKVLDVSDKQNRSIFLSLKKDQYALAIKAHSEGSRLRIVGDLEKKNRRNILCNIIKFQLCPEEEGD